MSDTGSCLLNGTAALSVIKIMTCIIFCVRLWQLEIFVYVLFLPGFVRVFAFLISCLAEGDLFARHQQFLPFRAEKMPTIF